MKKIILLLTIGFLWSIGSYAHVNLGAVSPSSIDKNIFLEGNIFASMNESVELSDANFIDQQLPLCTAPELILVAVDIFGQPVTCIPSGGEYYVLVTLSGGTGNLSYLILANLLDPIEVLAGASIVLGPFNAGVNVDVSAIGIQNGLCIAITSLDSPIICGPLNDNCETAIELSCGTTIEGTTEGASYSGMNDGCTSRTTADVFYALDVEEGNEYTISIGGSAYDAVLAIYSGVCGNLTEIACVNEEVGYETGESLTFSASSTETIIIRTYDGSLEAGSFTISIECTIITECTSPELSLYISDSDGGLVEGCAEVGSVYYVHATLLGGSGNSSYDITANGSIPESVGAESSVVLGPFDVGTDVSVMAEGIDNASCGASADILSPVVCNSCDDADSFITTWKTTASNQNITIPTFSGETYSYTVDWGDGNIDTAVSGDITHTYMAAGTYTVKICGTFPRIYFNNSGDRLKIRSIEQWGPNVWSSMNAAFAGTRNLVSNATDMPNLTMVNDMYAMFAYASKFNGDVNFGNWNVGNVTDMSATFAGASVFNHDINGWNVGNVTTMEDMFNGASIFNQNLGSWDVGNVVNMKFMFRTALEFNQDIGNWDVSQVTSMHGTFHHAREFNQDVGNWNVLNVTDMRGMFSYARMFDQNIGGWSVDNVTDMYGMFAGASVFNQAIGNWNVGNVTDMMNMFYGATVFNQDLGTWNVGNVKNMKAMFKTALDFNQDIGNWNVGKVTNMDEMLAHTPKFDQDLGNWNVIKLKRAAQMFKKSNLSTANYDALLNGWSILPLQNNVIFGGGQSTYCTGESARTYMQNHFNWTITDGGKDCTSGSLGERLNTDNDVKLAEISLYPNPVQNEMILGNPRNINLDNVSIYDLSGRLIQTVAITDVNSDIILDVSNLASATYMVLITGEGLQISKLMVKE